jgi:hypothetical protein
LDDPSFAGGAVAGTLSDALSTDKLRRKSQAETRHDTEASNMTSVRPSREFALLRCRKFVSVSEPKLRLTSKIPRGKQLRITKHTATGSKMFSADAAPLR